MRGVIGIAAVCVASLGAGRASAAPSDPRCLDLPAAVEALFAAEEAPNERILLASWLPPKRLAAQLERARASEGEVAQRAYLTLGFSRHADALKLLRGHTPPDADHAYGRALALLALGDGVGTASVSRALLSGAPARRIWTAEWLARMRQARPRYMLYDALKDDLAEVRLAAAERLILRRSRKARRTLRGLLGAMPVEIRDRAAAALFRGRYMFRPDELDDLPESLRGRAYVRAFFASRRRSLRRLEPGLADPDATLRAGAFAAAAALGGVSRSALERAGKRSLARHGAIAEAQLAATLALLGEADGFTRLSGLGGAGADAAVGVLWAFSGARAPYHRLDSEVADRWAATVTGWIDADALSPAAQAFAIEALARAETSAGLKVARHRLARGEGPGRAAAAEVLGTSGTSFDIGRLLAATSGLSPTQRIPLLKAAAKLCGR